MKHKIAMFIRVISIPPLMVTYLLALLFFFRDGVFATTGEFITALAALAIFPALAYPVAAIVPSLRKDGRPMQRKIAFLFSVIGYIGGFIYALTAGFSKPVLTIFTAYLASLLFLVLFNKVFKIRASGHACSVTSPMFFATYYFGPIALLPSALLYAAIFWASLVTKRHTVREFLLGTLVCVVSAGIAVIALSA